MSKIATDVRIRKAKKIIGNKLTFTDATEDDAEFILQLRIDEKKSRFISKVDSDIDKQKHWLAVYAQDESQAYFIIRDNEQKVGTVRLYDQHENSFCWGSWIIIDGVSSSYAIESALIIYLFARTLGLKSAHFTVTKGNHSVSKFHERFGAKIVKESDYEYFYEISEENISLSLTKYAKFIPDGIVVQR
jgi:RimJ/RimL family protein N-acetyltransferase